MCVVCVEDVEGPGCFILILWIRRALDVLVTLELDSQLKPGVQTYVHGFRTGEPLAF